MCARRGASQRRLASTGKTGALRWKRKSQAPSNSSAASRLCSWAISMRPPKCRDQIQRVTITWRYSARQQVAMAAPHSATYQICYQWEIYPYPGGCYQAGWNCDDGSGVWCEFCELWSYCIHW